ncbi:Ribonuclease E inhibitor RraB [Cronobacter condimenti 1330]|uniref:Ribonuclease E inhibitor RraB n=1 Tax=Cronobacter condimenti 1330 TaxID=1073999 RepID=K8AAB9_9ENTR|nr:Ribonuclease E inhibitor RraB [Cronobacter condimenti 1330]
MANPELLEEQREETRLIIEELLDDGSDPDALYTIEHHFSADDFDTLEKLAVEVFKLGYEVTDPEELELEEGGETVICCDALSECALNAELIDAQVEQLMNLAENSTLNTTAGVLTLKTRTAKAKKTTTTIWIKTTTVSVTKSPFAAAQRCRISGTPHELRRTPPPR